MQKTEFYDEVSSGGDEHIAACALILAAMAFGQSCLHNFPYNLVLNNLLAYLTNIGIKTQKDENCLLVQGNGMKSFGENNALFALEDVCNCLGLLKYNKKFQDLNEKTVKDLMAKSSAEIKNLLAFAKVKHKKEIIYNLTKKDYDSRFNQDYFYLKTAILFSALFETKKVIITEALPFCDHTERLFAYYDIKLEAWGRRENKITLLPPEQPILPHDLTIPNSISNVAPVILKTIFSKDGVLEFKNMLVNPKRIGFLYILKAMGADIQISNRSWFAYEPVADITVQGGKALTGVVVPETISNTVFSEMPLLIAAAAYAEGKTTFYGMGNNAKIEKICTIAEDSLGLQNAVILSAENILEVHGSNDMVSAERYWQNLQEESR